MLHFLSKFPSARVIRMAKPREISRTLIQGEGKRKRVFISSEEIIKLAQTSVASDSVAKELTQ